MSGPLFIGRHVNSDDVDSVITALRALGINASGEFPFTSTVTLTTAFTAEDVAQLLNEMLAADHAATTALIGHRVSCNEELAAHPTILVTRDSEVGVLGLLNALTGPHARVAAVVDDSGVLRRFQVQKSEDADGAWT